MTLLMAQSRIHRSGIDLEESPGEEVGGTRGSKLTLAFFCETIGAWYMMKHTGCRCWVIRGWRRESRTQEVQDSPKENAALITLATNHRLKMLVSEGMISLAALPCQVSIDPLWAGLFPGVRGSAQGPATSSLASMEVHPSMGNCNCVSGLLSLDALSSVVASPMRATP